MKVYINGVESFVDPKKSLGQGGEAEVFEHNGLALKIYKGPDHPDFDNQPEMQRNARERLETHQTKLPQFPKNLPKFVVTPLYLATNKGGKIIGYDMEWLRGIEILTRYFQPKFRLAGVSNDSMLKILRHLHGNVKGIHTAKVVIGDFNDLNVLVKNEETYLVDADSMQFGPFLCKVFTTRFVDPKLCDPNLETPILIRPHNEDSDWYAFSAMTVLGLLLTDVWGGIYNPKNKSKRIPHTARSLHRITVFNPEVTYPKPAVPYMVLPDDLLQHFELVFVKDKRGEFPIDLLENMRWTTCSVCGKEHARSICPYCKTSSPTAIKEIIRVRGKVTATRIFRTNGQILFATFQSGQLYWLYHESGQYKREGGVVIAKGQLNPNIRFRISGKMTLLAKDNLVMLLSPNQQSSQIVVDSYLNILPMFDVNQYHRYWINQGQLVREDLLDTTFYIGDVLEGQTLFWVGPAFGFGFYRAGNLNVAFVFDAYHKGLNDQVKIPHIRGQLIDSTAVFTKERCWFFTSTQEGGNTINRCAIILKNGVVEATAEALENDGSWLGTIRGKCPVGNFLLSATDNGIIRVEPDQGKITPTQEFPDTEPFVDTTTQLFPAPNGLYAVSGNEIYLLKIN